MVLRSYLAFKSLTYYDITEKFNWVVQDIINTLLIGYIYKKKQINGICTVQSQTRNYAYFRIQSDITSNSVRILPY